MLREYNESKEGIKNPKTSVEYTDKYGWYNQKKVRNNLCKNNSR